MIAAIGIYLVLSAVLRIYFRLRDTRADRNLISNGQRVSGKVIDRITYPDDDSLQSSQYRLIAEYSDSLGEKHFVKSRGQMCGADSRKAIGTEMEIIYDREDPARSRFSNDQPIKVSFWCWLGNALSAVLGLLLFLLEIHGDS